MTLKERQKSILSAAVREHIKTARPIASQDLVRESDLGLSSATIRNEMLCLDELGYLEQPHISAGRIPTDRGYRFFVDNLLSEPNLSRREKSLIEHAYKAATEEDFVQELSKTISYVSDAFTAVGLFENETFYETGFARVLDEPEFYDYTSVKTLGRLIDALHEELESKFKYIDIDEEKIFIGKENPWKEARSCAMILARWQHPQGFEGFLTIIGPKRTDYQKHKSIVRSLRKNGQKR